MRTIAITAAVFAVAAIGACSKPAQPAAIRPSVAVTTSAPSTGGTGAGSVVTSATSAPATSPPTSPAPPKPALGKIIGGRGIGALRLGMSLKQAEATGLLSKVEPFWAPDHQGLKGPVRATIKGSKNAYVFISPTRGIENIYAFGDIHTPAGIHVGSTRAELLKAYPTWKNVVDELPDGRGFAPAPGNNKAHYRIATDNGVVVELSLDLINQDFYE